MQFTTITALFLATTAVACPNGPYRTGSSCDQTCAGAQRCGDDNYVVSSPYPCLSTLSSPEMAISRLDEHFANSMIHRSNASTTSGPESSTANTASLVLANKRQMMDYGS
ncbi:hypothetical protein PTNB85_06512 [Pyrenophora teres f. teres]|nr:hypothetical protein HRS9139_07775 [Pyrenophora teres f. teres]KAE8832120.1 hypothetical protein PTNB85_06512 [Pyrenophora teres f. teres]KAE8855781.1 hypothetical protein PTNB29_08620 [Pyrenophora teres f. teres]